MNITQAYARAETPLNEEDANVRRAFKKHAYNHLPKVLEALTGLVENVRYERGTTLNALKRIDAIIAEASEVKGI